jgi:hypothetical protein
LHSTHNPSNKSSSLLSLEIADVSFSVWGDPSIIIQEINPVYKSFIIDDFKSTDKKGMKIHLDMTLTPDISEYRKIFKSGNAWTIYENNEGYCLTLDASENESPFWYLMINYNFNETFVFCSEKVITRKGGKIVIPNPITYPLDQVLLMYILSFINGMIIHAAGVVINKTSLLFPGKSGAGKSTISNLLMGKENFECLSDDRIILREIDGIFKGFGTPWPGDAGIAVNKCAPIAGLFFLNKDRTTSIKKISPAEAIKRLLPVASIPWYHREVLPIVLEFADKLISNIPAYELSFNQGSEVVNVLEEFVSKQKNRI